jgi:hypothetical protein
VPSEFASIAPDSAYWTIENQAGTWRQATRGYEFLTRLQAILNVTRDGMWGPATLAALDSTLQASRLRNAMRYADGFNPEHPGVTDAVLRAAIWLLNWTDAFTDIAWGRIHVPVGTGDLTPWRRVLPHTSTLQDVSITRVGEPSVPFTAEDQSVPTAVIEQAAQTGTPPTAASETPVATQPPRVPAVRPVGLPPAPLPVRPTGLSAGAVVGIVAVVLGVGAIAVSLSQSAKTAPSRKSRSETRARRSRRTRD